MPMLSEMTCDELKAAIVAAELAYSDLVMGNKARVVVDSSGERVEFVAASRSNLYAYLQSLRDAYNSKCGSGTCPAASRGPTGFLF